MSAFDAAIVGGGPAGVSCAIWLKQLGFKQRLWQGCRTGDA